MKQQVPLRAPNGNAIGVAEVWLESGEGGAEIHVAVSGIRITYTEWLERLQDAVTNTSAYSAGAETSLKSTILSHVLESMVSKGAGTISLT